MYFMFEAYYLSLNTVYFGVLYGFVIHIYYGISVFAFFPALSLSLCRFAKTERVCSTLTSTSIQWTELDPFCDAEFFSIVFVSLQHLNPSSCFISHHWQSHI